MWRVEEKTQAFLQNSTITNKMNPCFIHCCHPTTYRCTVYLLTVMLTGKWEGDCHTHMGFPLGWLSSHEGVGQAVLRATFPVAGLVIAFKLARAPAVVEGAVAATLLAELHVIIDHLIGICVKKQDRHRKRNQKHYSLAIPLNSGSCRTICRVYADTPSTKMELLLNHKLHKR